MTPVSRCVPPLRSKTHQRHVLPPARTFNDVEPLSLSTVSKTSEQHTYGSIDRVTGDVYATNTMKDTKTGKAVDSTDFTLKCRPAQRMF